MLVKTTGSAVNTVNLTTFPKLFASTQFADYTPRVAAVVSLYSHLRKADFNSAQEPDLLSASGAKLRWAGSPASTNEL